MASDNVRDVDRELFERVFFTTGRTVVMELLAQNLDPVYLETIIARMVALRAGACGCSVGDLLQRIEPIALDYWRANVNSMNIARKLADMLVPECAETDESLD